MSMSGTISATQYAALANDAYADSRRGSRVFGWTRQNFLGDPENGFFAAAYQNDHLRKTVIAYRGSGGDTGDWTMSGNLGNFLGIRTSGSQMNTALRFYDAYAGVIPAGQLSVCGHSLGGFLAAMVGLEKSVPAICFDRPTLGYSALRVTSSSTSNLFNFRADFDPVSGIRDGFGRWITVPSSIVERIVAGRAAGALSHSMVHLYEAILSDERSEQPPSEWR